MTATASPANGRIDKEEVRRLAQSVGWRSVVSAITGLTAEQLQPTHQPCPWCGGSDRYRAYSDFEQSGGVHCNQCGANADGFATISKALGFGPDRFGEVLRLVADQVGYRHSRANPPTADEDPNAFVLRICQAKRMPVKSAKAYGAQPTRHKRGPTLDFPMYGPDGKQCSSYRLTETDGRNEAGKPAGLFFPRESDSVRLPTAGETWVIVEGVKDAAALHGLGYLAVGLPTSSLNEKFAPLFDGVTTKHAHDLDYAGVDGAEKTRKALQGHAAKALIVRLPGEIRQSGGADVRDILAEPGGADLVREAIDSASDSVDDGTRPIEKFTFSDLRVRYATLNRPVIHGLAREAEVINLIAPPKYGKSWSVYNLLLSVVMGWSWLDKFGTSPGRVLLIDNELPRPVIADRIPRVAEAMGIVDFEEQQAVRGDQVRPYSDDVDVWPLRGGLRTIDEVARELQAIEPSKYKLIGLDAKYRFIGEGESENDNAAETRFYNLIDSCAEATGAAILLVHHASKGNQSGKAVTDVGAGAGAQARAADCHLVLREHEEPNQVVLEAAVRSFPPVAPVVLHWEFPLWRVVEGADPSRLKGKQTKQEERQSEKDRAAILELASAFNKLGRATRSQIQKETGWNRDKVNRLVATMLKNGDLDRGEVTNRGNKTDEFWLADSPDY